MYRSPLWVSQRRFVALYFLASCCSAFLQHRGARQVGRLYATEKTDDGTVLGSKYVLNDIGEESTSGKSTLVEAVHWQQQPQQRQQQQQQQQPQQQQETNQGMSAYDVAYNNYYNQQVHQAAPQPTVDDDDEEEVERQQRVLVKFSDNFEALEREVQNYNKVITDETKDLFVEIHDFYNPNAQEESSPPPPGADAPQFKGQAALVMERGAQDLQSYLLENGPLQGAALQEAVTTTARIIKACHDQGMVWTELKAPNFVVVECSEDGSCLNPFSPITIKAIDLESAVPQGSPPIDFSPEAIPPEFAVAYLCGREPYMEMQPTFDIFSLGLLWYKLATGRNYWKHYFDQPNDAKPDQMAIIQALRATEDQMPVPAKDSTSIEAEVQELISSCLKIEPEKRPSVDELLHRPYIAQVLQ